MAERFASFGASDDDASIPGGPGSHNAHLRLLTTQIQALVDIFTDVHDTFAHELDTSSQLTLTSGNVTVGQVGQGIANGGTSPWSVSGTVTSLQGTNPWIVSGGVDIGAPLPPGNNTIGNVVLAAGTSAVGTVSQGTGNAAGSPWSVSGSVSISNQPTTASGSVVTVLNGSVINVLGVGIHVAATSTEVSSSSGSVSGVVATSSLRLVGVSIRENAGTAGTAEVVIRHGTTVSDPALLFYKLAANESTRDWMGPDGIACASGLYIQRVSGTTHIFLHTKVVP